MKIAGRQIRGLLIDLDGVLYVGAEAVPGAVNMVERLQREGVPHLFLTNTTTRSRKSLVERLGEMGFHVRPESILTAPEAARSHLHSHGLRRCHLLLNDEVIADFSEFEPATDNVEAVVIGDIGDAWSYDLMNRVFCEVMDGAELIALHRNKFWKTERGLQMDIGAFVAGLEYVTDKEATLIGKPARAFFNAALKKLNLPAESVAMIGDDVESDVGAAQALGLTGVLVRTGKYRENHVRNSKAKPGLTIDSIADLFNARDELIRRKN